MHESFQHHVIVCPTWDEPDPCYSIRYSHDRQLHNKHTFCSLLHYHTLQYKNMSEPDIATRAPESDLAEQSAIPGDTAVDQGASLGVCDYGAQRAGRNVLMVGIGTLPYRPTIP